MPDDNPGLQLPYASEYLKETIFCGPMSGAHLPFGWTACRTNPQVLLTDVSHDEYMLHFSLRGRYMAEAKSMHEHWKDETHTYLRFDYEWQPMYWEAKILPDSISMDECSFSMGLMDRPSFESPVPEASELALAEYNCDGSVWTRGLLKDVVEPYAKGSIIGCGISPNPDTVFFTKDGRLICETSAPRSRSRAHPVIFCPILLSGKSRETEVSTYSNFDQMPFCFDIKEYFRSRFARTRYLAASLPEELLMMILKASLRTVLEYDPDSPDTMHTWRLSQVCRSWHGACIGHRYTHIALRSSGHLKYMSLAEVPSDFQTLDLHESSASPWVYRFFISRLFARLSSVSSWTWSSTSEVDVYAKLTPRFTLTIPVLVRNMFVNVQELTLRNCNFSSWTKFVKFVFAFPMLNRLDTGDIPKRWGGVGTSDVPPGWLRFTQRLEYLTFRATQDRTNCGMLCTWLFLAGRPRSSEPLRTNHTCSDVHPARDLTLSPQDISHISAILDHAVYLTELKNEPYHSPLVRIPYEAVSETSCSLSWCLPGSVPTELLSLVFRKHEDSNMYRFTTIRIHWARPSAVDWATADGRLRKLLTLLESVSDFGDCICEFELGPDDCREIRQEMMLGVCQEYDEGRIRFLRNGEDMGDNGPPPFAWMSSHSPLFGLSSKWVIGETNTVSWDVTQVKPDTQSIPWIKLFCVSNGNYATYCADVANEVDPYAGKAEIILAELRKVVGMARCFLVDIAPRLSRFVAPEMLEIIVLSAEGRRMLSIKVSWSKETIGSDDS